MNRYLVDSSVWLPMLLGQGGADEARDFISGVPPHTLHVSVLTLHSIGVVLHRRKRSELLRPFVHKFVVEAGVKVLSVDPEELADVADSAQRMRLDFDDAYQAVVAEKHGLKVVALDRDFARLPDGFLTPRQAFGRQDAGE